MRIELPREKKQVHEMVIPIRWGDMDALGHVNNASYFRYLETIRIDWMHAQGMPLNGTGLGPVIVNAFCNFYRQLVFPGEVWARLYVSDPGRTTFETWCELSRTDDRQTLYAAGGATVMWVDFAAQKAAPLPPWLRALVQG